MTEFFEEVTIPFSELRESDLVETHDGQWVPVVKLHEVHTPETMYKMSYENGQEFFVSGNHLHYAVTQLDRETYRSYCKEGRRLAKKAPKKVLDELEAYATGGVREELSLAGFRSLLGMNSVAEALPVLYRLSSSVGPVAELKSESTVPLYDAGRLSQQFLALNGDKRWRVLEGRVYTTEQLLEHENIEA